MGSPRANGRQGLPQGSFHYWFIGGRTRRVESFGTSWKSLRFPTHAGVDLAPYMVSIFTTAMRKAASLRLAL